MGGTVFGTCTGPCSDDDMEHGDCPASSLDPSLQAAPPSALGHCNCWQFAHATGVGFWPLAGCSGLQPLPDLWDDPTCVDVVMRNWKETAATVVAKGYKYLSTPLIAVHMSYARRFIEEACDCTGPGQCACTDASCGCPVYVGIHFYGYDCRPEQTGGYYKFESMLWSMIKIM